MLTVASFYVHRPEDFPKAADYPAMLRLLQTSCDRLGFHHVVLTDARSTSNIPIGVAYAPLALPLDLMCATTEAHARFLANPPAGDVLFVGADSILLADPRPLLPPEADLCVTSRLRSDRLDAINNGFMLIRERAQHPAAALYRRVADRCGAAWRDDQRSLVAELEPVPARPCVEERAGMTVGFLPMKRFNHQPLWPGDPCKGAVLLHFKGRAAKRIMPAWAKKHGFA